MSEQAVRGGDGEFLVVDSPYEVARWRPLVNWVLFIPHGIILNAMRALASVVFFIYWLALVFTGKLNHGMYGMLTMYERYNTRASGYLFGYSEDYSPFDFSTGPVDNNTYPPVTLNLPELPESTPRSAAFNFLLAIPHYFVFAVFAIGAVVVLIIGWFAVLLTGAWPKGMRDFLVRLGNYYYRIWAYVAMVETDYPRFGMSAT